MIDAMGNQSTTVYDAAGNVINTIDPLGNTTTYVYDADNRQTVKIDPINGSSETKSSDPIDNE
jgi:YD repeat-containing protein